MCYSGRCRYEYSSGDCSLCDKGHNLEDFPEDALCVGDEDEVVSLAVCSGCGKTAKEIFEYESIYEQEGYESADDYVKSEEGTYNCIINKFLCTECYINAGTPLGVYQE